MNRLIASALFALAAAGLVAGCHTDHVIPERTTTHITESGGEAISPDGAARLIFPEGAVDAPVDVTVEIVRGVEIEGLRSPLYELGPSGHAFETPITLAIQVGDSAEGRLRIAKVVDGAPQVVEGSTFDVAGGEVVAALSSFSRYGVFHTEDEDWDPCAGKVCGDECHLCPPWDAECAETAVVKYCDDHGHCDMAMPVCEGAVCEGPNPAEGCSKVGCDDGQACVLDDEACAPSMCGCDESGHWICTEDCGPGWVCVDEDEVYDPCGDKACGEQCHLCAPWDHDCAETTEVKVCDRNGACRSDTGHLSCEDDGNAPEWEPCAGLHCGDACTLCDPHDPDCAETTVLKFCSADGVCGMAYPEC